MYDLYDVAHVAGWGPYNLHGEYISQICTINITDPAQALTDGR